MTFIYRVQFRKSDWILQFSHTNPLNYPTFAQYKTAAHLREIGSYNVKRAYQNPLFLWSSLFHEEEKMLFLEGIPIDDIIQAF